MIRILIVDDHSDIRRLLSITLGKDFEILEAEDAASALDAVRRHHPTIVLLDVMMPGKMNGLDALAEIKASPQTQDILVAMISARGQVSDHDEARKLGADAYFVKPFSPLQVAAWVRSKVA
jgi:DNA-binding response OmpR family regulator